MTVLGTVKTKHVYFGDTRAFCSALIRPVSDLPRRLDLGEGIHANIARSF